jgi:hypothetical protein
MASGYVSWTTPDGNSPNPVYIDDSNKSVEFSAREDVAPYTITRPVGSAIYTLSNLGIINGFQCYRYAVYVTATTTTTTTTTEPPEITLSTTGTCVGGALEGSGRVVASGFSGGSGTYSTIRIGTSMENAFDADPIPLSGAPSYTFDNLNSAMWFVLVTDSAGYQGYARQIINCTNTTTTASPTSTTTAASTTTTTSTSTTSTSTTTTTGAPISFNLAFDASAGATACSNYPATNTALRYTYYDATLGNGIQLFTSNTLATAVANGYYSNGTNYWLATSGILNSQVSCSPPCGFNGGTAVWTAPPTTTTTTAAPTTTTAAPTTTTAAPTTTTAAPTTTTAGYTTFLITFTSTGDGAQACTDFDTPTNRNPYYAAPGAILTNGTVLYTNTALTTPAANGYYSNGAQYWNTGASSGMLANGTACDTLATTTTAAPTTTTAAPTTTTAAPTFRRSSASANDACTGGLTMTNVILDNTGLCNSNTISCDEFAFDIAGATVWISYAGDVREATINDPNTSGEATFIAACIGCSFVTTTTIGPGSLDYDCVGATCTYVGPGVGTYISLIECQTLSGCS